MKILILTSTPNSKFINRIKKKKKVKVYTSYNFKNINKAYDLVFTFNYDLLIPKKYFKIPKIGIFVLHSSDLPIGRGWAPIYNSIANKDKKFTVSLIKISEKPDSGNIILKINFLKPLIITNKNLREIDEDMVIKIVNRFINLCLLGIITKNSNGMKQNNLQAKYNRKRSKVENIVNKDLKLSQAIYKILATNKDYPAYTIIGGNKIYLKVYPKNRYKTKDFKLRYLNFVKK